MAWLWSSDQEYAEMVQPVRLNQGNLVRRTLKETLFSAQSHLHAAAVKLEQGIKALRSFPLEPVRPPEELQDLSEALLVVEGIVVDGEQLLLYHKRLALSEHSSGFLNSHDLPDHWQRYGSRRKQLEVDTFLEDAYQLLTGYHAIATDDEGFLNDMHLPDQLQADFALCRSLFSVGQDDLGVFTAGRGLETTLRAIAKRRSLRYTVRGKDEPVHDGTFHDVVEVFSRIRRADGTLLVEKETRSLLDYARTTRNSTAHSSNSARRKARELAGIMADLAQHLWSSSQKVRFTKEPIIKNW